MPSTHRKEGALLGRRRQCLVCAVAAVLCAGSWSPPSAAQTTAPDDADEASPATDATRTPPRRGGVITGVVKSRESGETLLEAIVTVIGRREKVTTDEDGRFQLSLPPGTYQLRVVYELHKPARVKNVVVAAGRAANVDVVLSPDASAVEEVSAIEAEVERASAATQTFLRKNAGQASDSVGAQDIAKTTDRNAAEALKRVVGTTVVDGRYIFVRGLGDRYTNALLNGSPLPSPEPDRQAVPLDMFPSLVISDLTISKTFLPDMPADFAGGSLDIHTRDLPNKFLFQTSLGVGLNSESTFGKRLDYRGGSLDWLGFDDGSRALPSEVPAQRVTRLLPDGSRNPNVNAVGKAINDSMESHRSFALPHGSGSFVVGDSFKLGGQRVLGYVAGATYTRKFQKRSGEIIRTYGIDSDRAGELVPLNDYSAETGTDTVTWSGLGSVSYAFDNDHKVSATGLYSRNAEKEARVIDGFNEEAQTLIRDERLRFVNRALSYGQLRGEHRFRNLNKAVLTWRGLLSRATLSDPDLRETVYGSDPITGLSFREGTQSGQHFFGAQGETTRSVGLDWLQPFTKRDGSPKVKLGGLVTLRGRSFQSRRFRFLRARDADNAVFRQSPNSLFTDDNVGPALELEEWTRPTDSYAAGYDVLAAYVMADLPVTSRLRLVVGERVEASRQTIDSYDPFAATSERSSSSLVKTDVLPSLNGIYKLTADSNLRLSVTRTVARPQLRELAPFVFSDFLGAREVLGNPELDRTTITNFDARFETFPRAGEVLAVTLFHKRMHKPIEAFIIPTSRGVLSYQNAMGAVNTGIELEARKSLEFVSDRVKEFSVLGNVTLVHSRVELDEAQGGIQTSRERPLAGQSPYVLNVAVDWAHEDTKTRARILYNVAGPRVAQVGTQGIPDSYEQPRHVLDVSIAQGVGEHVDLKLAFDNAFDSPVRFTQGTDDRYVANEYRLGRTVWLTGTYTH